MSKGSGYSIATIVGTCLVILLLVVIFWIAGVIANARGVSDSSILVPSSTSEAVIANRPPGELRDFYIKGRDEHVDSVNLINSVDWPVLVHIGASYDSPSFDITSIEYGDVMTITYQAGDDVVLVREGVPLLESE